MRIALALGCSAVCLLTAVRLRRLNNSASKVRCLTQQRTVALGRLARAGERMVRAQDDFWAKYWWLWGLVGVTILVVLLA